MSVQGLVQPVTSGISRSKSNSSLVPLGAGASFVGLAENVTDFTDVDITLSGAPAIAPGQLFFEFSIDGVIWDVTVEVTGADLSGPNIVPINLRIILPFFRLRYVNGSTPLTVFRLAAVYHRGAASRLTRFFNQPIDVTEGVETVRSVIYGQTPSNSFAIIKVDATGKILSAFTLAQPSAAVVTSVPQSLVVQTLLASNAMRLGGLISNAITNGFLYIKLGAGASPTDWTVKIAPGFAYELPFPAYTGQITGIWSTAGAGTAQVTEMQ